MKNKADLYKKQNPKNLYRELKKTIIVFKALIGNYERNKTITVSGYDVNHAINEAKNYCRTDEDVLEISRDTIVLWRHSYL